MYFNIVYNTLIKKIRVNIQYRLLQLFERINPCNPLTVYTSLAVVTLTDDWSYICVCTLFISSVISVNIYNFITARVTYRVRTKISVIWIYYK